MTHGIPYSHPQPESGDQTLAEFAYELNNTARQRARLLWNHLPGQLHVAMEQAAEAALENAGNLGARAARRVSRKLFSLAARIEARAARMEKRR